MFLKTNPDIYIHNTHPSDCISEEQDKDDQNMLCGICACNQRFSCLSAHFCKQVNEILIIITVWKEQLIANMTCGYRTVVCVLGIFVLPPHLVQYFKVSVSGKTLQGSVSSLSTEHLYTARKRTYEFPSSKLRLCLTGINNKQH